MACTTCLYANDHTFRFCQNCGYSRRRVSTSVPAPVSFNLAAMDERINAIQSNHLSTAYSKQKQPLKSEFESFLFALPGHKVSLMLPPWMSVAFWCSRIPKGKRRFITRMPSSWPKKHLPLSMSITTRLHHGGLLHW